MEPPASSPAPARTWRCRALGHLVRFRSEGRTMFWDCERGCGDLGSKTYPSTEAAQHFATSFDRRGADRLGHNAPLLGLWPLRLWNRLRHGSGSARD